MKEPQHKLKRSSGLNTRWLAWKENKNTKLEKHTVCTSCYCVGISDPECICCYNDNYKRIELEFEVCICCGNLIEDGNLAESEFNERQNKNLFV